MLRKCYGRGACSRAPLAESLTAWLLVYGIHFALAEGTEKAMVADLAPPALRGTAFGIFHGIIGFASLLASVVFGVVWTTWGAPVAFGLGASLALVASGLLVMLVRTERQVVASDERPA